MALFGKKKGADDPFGDDGDWWDFEEDDLGSESISRNRWLAYASTLILVILAMFAALASMTIDQQRGPQLGTMPEMVVEPPPPVVEDPVDDTARSVARRPWLAEESGTADTEVEVSDIAEETLADPEPEADVGAPPPVQLAPREPPAVLDWLPPGTPDLYMVARRVVPGEELDSEPVLRVPSTPPLKTGTLAPPPPRLTSLPTDRSVYFDPDAAALAPNRVAVVVAGLGLSRAATEFAIDLLPPEVTLSFDPYANSLSTWVARASEAGHDVLVGLPAQGRGYPVNDPGPIALTSDHPVGMMQEELTAVVQRTGSRVMGVVVHGNGFLAGSDAHIQAIASGVDARQLMMLQVDGVLSATPSSHVMADARIDARPFRAAIDAHFAYMEEVALYRGSAVAVMSARPSSLERLVIWLDGLAEREVGLVKLSEISP